MANEQQQQTPQALGWMRRLQRARQASRTRTQNVATRQRRAVSSEAQLSAARLQFRNQEATADQVPESSAETDGEGAQEEQGGGQDQEAEQPQEARAAGEAQEQAQEQQEVEEQTQEDIEAQRQQEAERQRAEAERVRQVNERRTRLALIFFPLLIIAMAKDILDIFSVESLSWIDWILDLIIGTIMFLGYPSGRGELRQTASLMRKITPTILEAIPILGILPIWTIAVILMTVSQDQEQTTNRAMALHARANARLQRRLHNQ